MAEEVKLPERPRAIAPPAYQRYNLGDFTLQCGDTFHEAWIAYKTFDDVGSSAILYPKCYSGSIANNEWLIGQDKTLNPQQYFIIIIIITVLFGNGQSISLSSLRFWSHPLCRLLTEELGNVHLRIVAG